MVLVIKRVGKVASKLSYFTPGLVANGLPLVIKMLFKD